MKGSEKTLKNQNTYLGAFLALLFPFLARFGEESEDFLFKSITVSLFWESEREERRAGTQRGGGFGGEGIKRPWESRILGDGESSEEEGKSVAVEGGSRAAGAAVASSISAGPIVSSDAGGSDTRDV